MDMYLQVRVSVSSDQRPSSPVSVNRMPLFTTTPAMPLPDSSSTLPDTLKTVCRATPPLIRAMPSSNTNNAFTFISRKPMLLFTAKVTTVFYNKDAGKRQNN